MQVLHYIAGPLLGAVIGYFTNYIAVKMLFIPRHEVRVFGRVLPFTPGAIPKGKDRLARSAGEVVSANLLSKEDLEKRLLSPQAVALAEKAVDKVLSGTIESNVTPLLPMDMTYVDAREKTINAVSLTVEKAVRDMKVGNMIAGYIREYIMEKSESRLLKFLMEAQMFDDVIETLAGGVNQYCDDNAYRIVEKQIRAKADNMRGETIEEILNEGEVDAETARKGVLSAYENIIRNSMESFLKKFDVAGMVEAKISAMSPEELEKLVLSVMKNELNMIVSLGALIGFVLGLVMLFMP